MSPQFFQFKFFIPFFISDVLFILLLCADHAIRFIQKLHENEKKKTQTLLIGRWETRERIIEVSRKIGRKDSTERRKLQKQAYKYLKVKTERNGQASLIVFGRLWRYAYGFFGPTNQPDDVCHRCATFRMMHSVFNSVCDSSHNCPTVERDERQMEKTKCNASRCGNDHMFSVVAREKNGFLIQ